MVLQGGISGVIPSVPILHPPHPTSPTSWAEQGRWETMLSIRLVLNPLESLDYLNSIQQISASVENGLLELNYLYSTKLLHLQRDLGNGRIHFHV